MTISTITAAANLLALALSLIAGIWAWLASSESSPGAARLGRVALLSFAVFASGTALNHLADRDLLEAAMAGAVAWVFARMAGSF